MTSHHRNEVGLNWLCHVLVVFSRSTSPHGSVPIASLSRTAPGVWVPLTSNQFQFRYAYMWRQIRVLRSREMLNLLAAERLGYTCVTKQKITTKVWTLENVRYESVLFCLFLSFQCYRQLLWQRWSRNAFVFIRPWVKHYPAHQFICIAWHHFIVKL